MYECRIGSTLGHLSVSDREITVLSFFRSHLLPLQYSLIRAILGNMSVNTGYVHLFELHSIIWEFIHIFIMRCWKTTLRLIDIAETQLIYKAIFGFLVGKILRNSYFSTNFLLLMTIKAITTNILLDFIQFMYLVGK